MHQVAHTYLGWHEHRGSGEAEHDGVRIALRVRPPVLRHIRAIEELVYAPEAHARYVQEVGQARRDLMPGETTECLLWLVHMSTVARDAATKER